MSNFVVTIKNLKKNYLGGKEVIKNLTLSFFQDAKIGILGHNGAGKSTLLKIIAGLDKEFSGEVWIRDGIKVGYLPQEPKLDENLTVKDNIMVGLKEKYDLLEKFNTLSLRFAEELTDDEMNALIEEQSQIQEKIESLNAWNLDREIDIAMDALRCPHKDKSVANLSGGEKRRIALARLLLEAPDIILLDEPTNHLDAESVSWLEKYLQNYKGMVMIVTHDRYFLDNVTGWILELERGEGYPYEGNYSSWLKQKQKRLEQEEKEESSRQKTLKQELTWISSSQKARQTKSKARIKAYEDLLSVENEKLAVTNQITIPIPKKLGDLVITAENISKSFEDKLLFKDLSFIIPKGAIVGIIGENGAGKSTLFKIITNTQSPDTGSIKIGNSVTIGYVDQSRDALNDENNVWQEISEGLDEVNLGSRTIQSRSYVAQFNFKGTDQQKRIGSLSGGERNRVHLAKMLKKGSNVLLLDEPTNDLDVDTLRALETAIETFAGCVLVISHDRWFLNRIATHIMAFEGNGFVYFNEGNFEDYEADKIKRLGIQKTSNTKYKPLMS